jgi:hypothetical protein
MSQYSTGVFPREKFDLDAEFEVTTSATAAPIPLTSIRTIRVIVLGAAYTAPTGNGTAGRIEVTVGGKVVTFGPGDFDTNGVGIAHIRGALCDANNNISYALVAGSAGTGTAGSYTVDSVYLDAVDNVG